MNEVPWEWSIELKIEVKDAPKEDKIMTVLISSHNLIKIYQEKKDVKGPLAVKYQHCQAVMRLANTLYQAFCKGKDPIEIIKKTFDKTATPYHLESFIGSKSLKSHGLQMLTEKEFNQIVEVLCGKNRTLQDHPKIVYPVGARVKFIRLSEFHQELKEEMILNGTDPKGDTCAARYVQEAEKSIGQIVTIYGHCISKFSHMVKQNDMTFYFAPEDLEPVID